ncbi:MAG: hypothetical protein ABIO65_08470, partial [Nitrospiria bacterium]
MRRLTRARTLGTLAVMIGLLAAVALVATLLGEEPIGVGRLLTILTGSSSAEPDVAETILWQVRG